MKRKKFSRINKILEIPEEIVSNTPKITILGCGKLMIENYISILEYQDFFIRIDTEIGVINISGLKLELEEMTDDDIIVNGCIESVEFEKT